MSRTHDRDTSIKQVGLEVISGEFELSAGFIGGMFGLGKDFATRLVNFEARTDLPSHLVYATRKNTYMGSGSKRRHNPYTNSSSPSRSAKSSSRTGGKYVVEKDALLFSDQVFTIVVIIWVYADYMTADAYSPHI